MIKNYPNSLLTLLNEEQKKSFVVLLNKKTFLGLDLVKEINKLLSSFRGLFISEKNYKQLLLEISSKRNLVVGNDFSVYQLEECILENKFKTFINNLGEEERRKFQEELKTFATKNGIDANQIKSLTTIGTLASANFAGFGLYVMASTVVGGITSAIGLTLPFAVYTGMSSVLSVITGPIGWIAGLGYLSYTFRNDNLETAQNKLKVSFDAIKGLVMANLEHSEIIVSQICSYRILLLSENETKSEENNLRLKNIEKKSAIFKEKRNKLQEEIKKLNYQLGDVNNDLSKLSNESIELTKEIMINEFKINQLK